MPMPILHRVLPVPHHVVMAVPANTWMDQAACLTIEPDLFFAAPSDAQQLADALATCGGCPVTVACGNHADTLGLNVGVWGGALRG